MSAIHFLVTVSDSGVVIVDKVDAQAAVAAASCYDKTFDQALLEHGSSLDIHATVQHGKTLLRIAAESDEVPKFTSMDEADAWLERRSGVAVS